MPTPFNEATVEGWPQTFEQFVLRDLNGRPLPEKYVPSDYHKKQLEQAQEKLAMLERLDDDAWNRRAANAYEQEVQQRQAYLREAAEKRARVETRMAEVRAWRPPTPDHESHKNGMLRQLKLALEDDCSTSFLPEPIRRTGQELKKQELADIKRSINDHTTRYWQEVQAEAKRTAWVSALRESLAQPKPGTTEQTE